MARTPSATFPLAGTRILVGRARHQAGELSSSLRSLGATVLEVPFIEIRKPKSFAALDASLRDLSRYHWLILTSANGVEALWGRLRKLRMTRRRLAHLKVAAIGPATCKAITQKGIKVDVVPEEYVAESVVKSLSGKIAGQRVLLVRAKVARDVIPVQLRAAGAHVDVVEAYETVVPKTSRARLRAALRDPAKRPHLVTFTSSSTVRNFVALAGNKNRALRFLKFASIGPVTSATLREFGLPVDIQAREFTMGGLVRAIVIDAYAERTVP